MAPVIAPEAARPLAVTEPPRPVPVSAPSGAVVDMRERLAGGALAPQPIPLPYGAVSPAGASGTEGYQLPQPAPMAEAPTPDEQGRMFRLKGEKGLALLNAPATRAAARSMLAQDAAAQAERRAAGMVTVKGAPAKDVGYGVIAPQTETIPKSEALRRRQVEAAEKRDELTVLKNRVETAEKYRAEVRALAKQGQATPEQVERANAALSVVNRAWEARALGEKALARLATSALDAGLAEDVRMSTAAAKNLWNTTNDVFFGRLDRMGRIDPRHQPLLLDVMVKDPDGFGYVFDVAQATPTVAVLEAGTQELVKTFGYSRPVAEEAVANFLVAHQDKPAFVTVADEWGRRHQGQWKPVASEENLGPGNEIGKERQPSPPPGPVMDIQRPPAAAEPPPKEQAGPAMLKMLGEAGGGSTGGRAREQAQESEAARREVDPMLRPGESIKHVSGREFEKDSAGNLHDVTTIREALDQPPPQQEVKYDWWRRAVGMPDRGGPGFDAIGQVWNVVFQQGKNMDSPEGVALWKKLSPEQKGLVKDALKATGALRAMQRERGL